MGEVSARTNEAVAAYRASQNLDTRPSAVLAQVHDELRRSLASAISAYEQGALDQMCRHNARATHLLGGLCSTFDASGDGVQELLAFYRRVQFAINRMLRDEREIIVVRNCLNHLNSMSLAFRHEAIRPKY